MRTSLNNIKAIDDYLSGKIPTGDALLFEANMLLNNDWVKDMEYQQNTYTLIRQYGSQNIKSEIISVQKILFTEPQHQGFMYRIVNLFKK
jgi:hypothetical protein